MSSEGDNGNVEGVCQYNNSAMGMQNVHTVKGGGDTTFVQNLTTDTLIISNNTAQNVVIQNVVAQKIIVKNNNIHNLTLNTGASP
ncbi:hypothetical protein V5O48_014280, partial [Marasmius crinis-equi]